MPQHLYKSYISLTPSLPPDPHKKGGSSLTGQKFLKAQRDIPITILIIPLKHIRHPLQHDAALHEQIEAHPIVAVFLVRAVEERDEGGGEAVAERDEGVAVFGEGDVAAAIFVEAVEERAPGGEEAPEAAGKGVDVSFLWDRLISLGVVGSLNVVLEQRGGVEGVYQNSSKPMVPLLSASNIRIIIFTVCGSKLV